MIDTQTSKGLHSDAPARSLAPAMRFVLRLAKLRARRPQQARPARPTRGPITVDRSPLGVLWELAERFHPEQTWLAESWVRGERTLTEIERTAPRESLSLAFIEAARHRSPLAATA
jgi:hypothetical protein